MVCCLFIRIRSSRVLSRNQRVSKDVHASFLAFRQLFVKQTHCTAATKPQKSRFHTLTRLHSQIKDSKQIVPGRRSSSHAKKVVSEARGWSVSGLDIVKQSKDNPFALGQKCVMKRLSACYPLVGLGVLTWVEKTRIAYSVKG